MDTDTDTASMDVDTRSMDVDMKSMATKTSTGEATEV